MKRLTRFLAFLLAGCLFCAAAPAETLPSAPTPPPPTEAPATGSDLPQAAYTLKAVGAVLRRTDEKNRAVGEKFTEMTVSPADSVLVSAEIPKGKAVDCWILNGVRYDFAVTVKTLRLTGFDRSWTVEAVLKKAEPETQHTAEDRPPLGEAGRLVVRVEGGELCHMKSATVGGGGWIDSFDFTYDYENRATGAEESGGRLTCKVRATVPRGRRILGWRFGGTEIYPGTPAKTFVVTDLDTAMVYGAILNEAADKKGEKEEPTPSPTPEPTPVPLVRVVCRGCVFSGGGYEDVTEGEVMPGTEITVRSFYYVHTWSMNDALVMGEDGTWFDGQSLTRVIDRDTTFVCVHKLKESN